MTPWSQLAPKVHLRRKVNYWKCHFLSALHFPEIQGSRSEIFRLHRFSFTWDSLSPNTLPGVAVLTSICTKGFHGLQATSCRLQARGGRLQATGNRLQVRSNKQARGYKQQATSYRLSYRLQASWFGVDPKIISVCWRAFRKQWFSFVFVA